MTSLIRVIRPLTFSPLSSEVSSSSIHSLDSSCCAIKAFGREMFSFMWASNFCTGLHSFQLFEIFFFLYSPWKNVQDFHSSKCYLNCFSLSCAFSLYYFPWVELSGSIRFVFFIVFKNECN